MTPFYKVRLVTHANKGAIRKQLYIFFVCSLLFVCTYSFLVNYLIQFLHTCFHSKTIAGVAFDPMHFKILCFPVTAEKTGPVARAEGSGFIKKKQFRPGMWAHYFPSAPLVLQRAGDPRF
jgi:hypothetical protein